MIGKIDINNNNCSKQSIKIVLLINGSHDDEAHLIYFKKFTFKL